MSSDASVITQASLANRQLPYHDIQGLILCEYGLPAVRHMLIRIAGAAEGRRLVGMLVNNPQSSFRISTTEDWTKSVRPTSALNIGFTYAGLKALRLPAATLDSFVPAKAFMSGAAARAALVGDCGKSAPHHWRGRLNSDEMHILLSLYADKGQIENLSKTLDDIVRQNAATVLHEESGATLEDGVTENEGLPGVLIHFGYRDGISQPVVAGAPRPQCAPAKATSVSPGAFLLGYPSQWLEFQYSMPRPLEFGRNGSFAAFRILQQDVVAFEQYLTAAAKVSGLDKETIAAKVCGRWRNGVPLVLCPQSSSPPSAIPSDKLNDFDFTQDPKGLACPFDAHIRRTNPRGEPVAGADSDKHPIIRRGMPYGSKYDLSSGKGEDIERGLLGLFICASLEDQFEFLMTNWMNRGGYRPELPNHTKDLIAGSNVIGETIFQLPTSQGVPAVPQFSQFVTTRGAAYCFLPSITGLKYIANL